MIRPMRSTAHKLLALLLSLSLLFAPLQGMAAAWVDDAVPAEHAGHVMAMEQGVEVAALADSGCEPCGGDRCCSGSVCATAHCAGCVPAVPAAGVRFPTDASAAATPMGDGLPPALIPSSLFRPPRA